MAKPSHQPDKENDKNGVNTELEAELGFPSEFPYEFDSFGGSPSSVAGSTETESSDEEDFFAGLTRRLSQATIHETRNQLTVPICNSDKAASQKKTLGLAGSPQSTLSGIGSWSGRSSRSGHGSPNGSSTVPSPTTTPFSAKNDAWEVINAAAGQVARFKMNDDVSNLDFQNRGVPSGIPKVTPQTLSAENRTPSLFENQNLLLSLNHASQVQMQEQVLKQQGGSLWGRQGRAYVSTQQQFQVQNRGYGSVNVKCSHGVAQSAWPPLQVKHQNQQFQHCGSGSRPVLSSGSGGVKRGCGGTGVFLPRQYATPPEPRKKTSCAPVAVPAKVIHALNSFDDINAPNRPRFSSPFVADYDVLLARRNAVLMQQRLSLRREEAANYDIRLPQEWTY